MTVTPPRLGIKEELRIKKRSGDMYAEKGNIGTQHPVGAYERRRYHVCREGQRARATTAQALMNVQMDEHGRERPTC